MSEHYEHGDHEHDDEFVFPPGLDAETREKIKTQIRAQRDSAETFKHEVGHFFTTLNEDQMRILRTIFYGIDADNVSVSDYYAGILTSLLHAKFDYCLACGVKHVDELHEMIKQAQQEQNIVHPDADATSWADRVSSLTDETKAQLAEYRMNLIDPFPKVVCVNCGMTYPNLEDRMLKTPDDCSGCHQKAAFG